MPTLTKKVLRITSKKLSARMNGKASSKLKTKKRVYFFGNGKAEGGATMKELLGGKGANLADMTSIGLPVPPGFTITTETCADYNHAGQKLPRGLMDEVQDHLHRVEKATGKKFGDPQNPLLLSVRSGAKVSMPGMMDTVLNLGLTDVVTEGLGRLTGNERFAYDSYRRLINMFGDVVMGVDHEHFEHQLSEVKRNKGVQLDTDLSADDLKEVVRRYKEVYKKHLGVEWPQEPLKQLEQSIEAVFKSWNTDRAVRYRQINDIRGLAGTAVNCQTMVFGNMGDDSATGVAFTRNPSTGENKFYGEFLINAQGEDVVAGIRTPIPCEQMGQYLPKSWKELLNIKNVLESDTRMCRTSCTIEKNKLYMLQTRNGKRTTAAAVRSPPKWSRRPDHEPTAILHRPARSTSSSTRCSTLGPAACRACPLGPPRRSAGSPSPPRSRSAPRRKIILSVAKPSLLTSAACTSPKAFSPAPAV
jgi:pyruvate,orthophosphate dikinase